MSVPTPTPTPPTQTSVWYFVAATFIFVSPTLYFGSIDAPWLPLVTLSIGGVVIALGFRAMNRERAEARRLADAQRATDEDPPAES